MPNHKRNVREGILDGTALFGRGNGMADSLLSGSGNLDVQPRRQWVTLLCSLRTLELSGRAACFAQILISIECKKTLAPGIFYLFHPSLRQAPFSSLRILAVHSPNIYQTKGN